MMAPRAVAADISGRDVTVSRLRTPESSANDTLRTLILAQDESTADAIAASLAGIFGDRLLLDWIDDQANASQVMHGDAYDLYFLEESGEDDVVAAVRGAVDAGCEGAIIVVADRPDGENDLKTIDAGAADHVVKADLAPALLTRLVRHALVRQSRLIRARREVARLTAEKQRLNRLRVANHRFVENACHDFRSPLTVIKEFSSIIAEGLAGDVSGEQSEFLEIILNRVDNLSHMVDAILDASRLESDAIGVHREAVPVSRLIEAARPNLEKAAGDGHAAISFAVEEPLPDVFADLESVNRVIVNLVTNACKFTGEDGKITVWARHDPEERQVTIGVSDNGPGIAPEHMKLIFDRFQQLPGDDATASGFGLGLHISSELVRVNFGTLTVESEPGRGSTFMFTLPEFDVESLIRRHFGFLSTSRHGFHKVSLVIAASEEHSDEPALAELERFLSRQVRSYDLLLRMRRDAWLLCLACSETEVEAVTSRILRSFAEYNRNRPIGKLPAFEFRPVGSWPLNQGAEDLPRAVDAILELAPRSRELH